MAKIYEKANSMRAESIKYRNKAVIIGLIGVFFLILSHIVFRMHFFILSPISGFSGILLINYAGVNWRKYQQLNSGVKGKQQTLSFVSSLSDSYSVVTNPNITYQGQSSMLDTVVIGPNGVFVIQTKNHNGTIEGIYTDEQFIQHKIGQGGTPYSSQFYSPIKQVSTHVFRLSKLLREYGYNVWVQGIVYFSNPITIVNVDYNYNEVPVFAASQGGAMEMCSYISSYTPKSTLSDADIEKIVNMIL